MDSYIDIPNFKNLKELSYLLGISEYALYKMTRKPEKYYRVVIVPKKDGSERILACPSSKVKAVQAWILRYILDKLSPDKSATAFKKGLSTLDNVQRHVDNDYFLCLDIKDFFPSTKASKVYQLFLSLKYSTQAAMILTNLCTFQGGLPQGGVTSPALSNLLNLRMDRKISEYCASESLIYTRYADDITISSNHPKKITAAQDVISEIIIEEGYVININKTRILGPGKRRMITGLIYNEIHDVRIGKKKKKIIRAKMHKLANMDYQDEEYFRLKRHIQGWLNYLKNIDLKTYTQLNAYNEKLTNRVAGGKVAAAVEDETF